MARTATDAPQITAELRSSILAAATRRLGDPSEAQDVTQEVLLRLSQNTDLIGAEPEHVRAWCLSVTRNVAVDTVRARLRGPAPTGETAAFDASESTSTLTAEDEAVSRDELRRVMTAMRRLPEQYRAILLAASVGEVSHADIAATHGLSVDAVRNIVFRARNQVKAHLTTIRAIVGPVFLLPLRLFLAAGRRLGARAIPAAAVPLIAGGLLFFGVLGGPDDHAHPHSGSVGAPAVPLAASPSVTPTPSAAHPSPRGPASPAATTDRRSPAPASQHPLPSPSRSPLTGLAGAICNGPLVTCGPGTAPTEDNVHLGVPDVLGMLGVPGITDVALGLDNEDALCSALPANNPLIYCEYDPVPSPSPTASQSPGIITSHLSPSPKP